MPEYQPQPATPTPSGCAPQPAPCPARNNDKRRQRGQDFDEAESTLRPPAEPLVPPCTPTSSRTTAPIPVNNLLSSHKMIDRLSHAMALQRELVAMNYLDNVRRYLVKTGGDGALAMSKTSFAGLANKAVIKTLATLPAKLPMDRALDVALGSLAKAFKIAGGLVLGVLYDALVEHLFDPTGKKIRAAFAAGHSAGVEAMAAIANDAVAMRLTAFARDALVLEDLRKAVTCASSTEALDGLNDWVARQIPALTMPVIDDSLYQQMLETWVLQRAGDEEDANKHTDAAMYDKAHADLAHEGDLARRDLFIHQARFELGRLGVDAEPTLALWQTVIDALPGADPAHTIATLGPLRIDTARFAAPDRFIRTIRDSDGRYAFALTPFAMLLDSSQIAESEEKGLPSKDSQVGSVLHADIERSKQLQDTLRSGGVHLSVQVELTEADGAIFVDSYKYTLTPSRGNEQGMKRPHHVAIRRTEWTDSPD